MGIYYSSDTFSVCDVHTGWTLRPCCCIALVTIESVQHFIAFPTQRWNVRAGTFLDSNRTFKSCALTWGSAVALCAGYMSITTT
jgi:hypothetical protein